MFSWASRARDIHCKYPRCEQHDKIKFNENKLSRGPHFTYSRTPGWETLVYANFDGRRDGKSTMDVVFFFFVLGSGWFTVAATAEELKYTLNMYFLRLLSNVGGIWLAALPLRGCNSRSFLFYGNSHSVLSIKRTHIQFFVFWGNWHSVLSILRDRTFSSVLRKLAFSSVYFKGTRIQFCLFLRDHTISSMSFKGTHIQFYLFEGTHI
jgi:hypothetical protein